MIDKMNQVLDAQLAEEAKQPLRWWYLSFGDAIYGFLGGAFVEARGILTAAQEARRLGINPGGEVLGAPAPEPPPEEARGKLLAKEDLERIFGGITRLTTTGTDRDREIKIID
jgi:hypothetical protein